MSFSIYSQEIYKPLESGQAQLIKYYTDGSVKKVRLYENCSIVIGSDIIVFKSQRIVSDQLYSLTTQTLFLDGTKTGNTYGVKDPKGEVKSIIISEGHCSIIFNENPNKLNLIGKSDLVGHIEITYL